MPYEYFQGTPGAAAQRLRRQVDALSDCRGPHVFDAEDVRLVLEYLEANERARLAEHEAYGGRRSGRPRRARTPEGHVASVTTSMKPELAGPTDDPDAVRQQLENLDRPQRDVERSSGGDVAPPHVRGPELQAAPRTGSPITVDRGRVWEVHRRTGAACRLISTRVFPVCPVTAMTDTMGAAAHAALAKNSPSAVPGAAVSTSSIRSSSVPRVVDLGLLRIRVGVEAASAPTSARRPPIPSPTALAARRRRGQTHGDPGPAGPVGYLRVAEPCRLDGEVAGLDLVAHLEEQGALPAAAVRHAVMADDRLQRRARRRSPMKLTGT